MEFIQQASSPYLECKIEGLDKNQDIAFCGKTNFDDSSKDYCWFVGCDGHGKKDKFNIIEILKQMDDIIDDIMFHSGRVGKEEISNIKRVFNV